MTEFCINLHTDLQEFSRRVLAAGGKVVLADNNVEAGEATAAGFRETFGEGRCVFSRLDVTDR